MKIKIYHELPTEAKQIREEVFIKEQGFKEEYDETDEIATHLVLFLGSEPVATCRLFASETEKNYVLGRLAVKKEHRKHGIGSHIVAGAIEHLKSIGADKLILHSQLTAKEFYAKLGFSEYGEVEYEEDCPHIWMEKEL